MTGLGSSCGACKFLRRRCTNECVFAPYFSYNQAATHFAAVHKVFGASNVSKHLLSLPVQSRSEAAITISYEALARMQDPIYGCVGHIFALQQQVANLQEEIEMLGSQMVSITVGAPSCGTSEAIDNPYSGLQFSSQHDADIMQYYLNQQIPVLPHTRNTTINQALDTLADVELPPLLGWEEHDLLFDSAPNPLERLLEGIDQEIFAFYPWLDNGNDAKVPSLG